MQVNHKRIDCSCQEETSQNNYGIFELMVTAEKFVQNMHSKFYQAYTLK